VAGSAVCIIQDICIGRAALKFNGLAGADYRCKKKGLLASAAGLKSVSFAHDRVVRPRR